MGIQTPTFDAHRERLIQLFALHVRSVKPETLLDVGCGLGRLLQHLPGNIRAQGVDGSERRVAEAADSGLAVQRADAVALPFDDGAFDWVVIRHVLHHLDDPGAAVREAWRVARSGVILAEPTTDPSIPSQREMARFDAFTAALMGRNGHVHHPYLGAGELLALVPGEPQCVETRSYGELTAVPADEARALGEQAAHGGELTDGERSELEAFVGAAGERRLTYNGSVAVFCHRRPLEQLAESAAPAGDVALREVDDDNIVDVIRTGVAPMQRRFVADNVVSLAQAALSRHAWFRAVYAGDEVAGFVMLELNPDEDYCPFLWRFMIGARFQGRDVGRRALALVFEHLRAERGFAKLWTSAVVAPGGPLGFYERIGFTRTGKVEDGEHVLVREL
ncbi:MAG: GNAT family N-acetyltransferase [Planctomycetota bacterium]